MKSKVTGLQIRDIGGLLDWLESLGRYRLPDIDQFRSDVESLFDLFKDYLPDFDFGNKGKPDDKLGDEGKSKDTLIDVEATKVEPYGEQGVKLEDTVISVTVEKNDRNEYDYNNNSAVRDAIDADQDGINKKEGR